MDEAGPRPPQTAASLGTKLPTVCRTCLASPSDETDPEFELYQIDEIFLEEDEVSNTHQVHSFVEVLSLFVNDGVRFAFFFFVVFDGRIIFFRLARRMTGFRRQYVWPAWRRRGQRFSLSRCVA